MAACLELGRVLENNTIFRGLRKAITKGDIQRPLEQKPLKRRNPKRRLTIENVPSYNKSSLLCLPREIRDAIWRYACMDLKIHWWMQNGKLKGQLCRSQREHCQLRCTAWIQKSGNPPFQKMGIMGLLLSCRSIYSEIINFVYELVAFDTRDPEVIIFLPRFLLPQRMHLIRSLEFLWMLRCFPSPKLWDAVWRNLSELEGLKELTVELYLMGDYNSWMGPNFVISTRRVVRPKQFNLILPERLAREVAGKHERQNCTIINFESINY